jgi:pullulanase/glycogen debranching enzyme
LSSYGGLVEKIPWMKELGVTIVELMPVHQFDPQEANYLGYNDFAWFLELKWCNDRIAIQPRFWCLQSRRNKRAYSFFGYDFGFDG